MRNTNNKCQQMRRAKGICRHCGKTFKPKAKDRITFCGRPCAFAYRRALAKERKAFKVKNKPQRLIECVICGKPFQVRTKRQKYCSDVCRREKERRRFRSNFVSAKHTNPMITKTCCHCGERFVTNYRAARRKYCSSQCGDEVERRRYLANMRARRKAIYDQMNPQFAFQESEAKANEEGDTP